MAVSLAVAIKPIAIIALPFVGLLWAGRFGSWRDRIRSWVMSGVVLAVVLTCVFLVTEAGEGVLSAAFGTPSGVLTWLSPTTAVGKLLGMATSAVGLTADDTAFLAVVRLAGVVVAVAVVAWLILRPGGRSPVRGAALALGVVVVLGPVVQPWYLLWFLPLFAVTGLTVRELRVAVLATAGFTVHGMIESTTNADNIFDAADVVTYVVAFTVVAVVLLASPRERRLVLGPADGYALAPMDVEQQSAAEDMRWPASPPRRLVTAADDRMPT